MTQTGAGPTRVVHVALQLAMGGMEKLLVEFARHADRDRFAPAFVCLGGRGTLADDIEACGCPVVALGEPPGLRPGLAIRLARLLRRLGAEVVHTHNTKPLLYGVPAARMARVPAVVHTRHGQRYGASRRETVVFRAVANRADRVVCVSEDSAALSAREGVDPGRLRTIWNGIDTARFAYEGPKAGGPAVMVGRLSPEKDVQSLLHAAAIVLRDHPSFRLEIAGDGPCMPELSRLAGELAPGGQVRLLGEVRDIPGLLARASLFVLPSLTEGVSLTLLEAMARGLPVVATRVGGNTEVVVDGETGHLAPPGSPPELADAILRMALDPEGGRRMGRAGRARVERHFEVRRMVAGYEALYRDAMRGRRAGRRGGASGDDGAGLPLPAGGLR